MPDSTAIDRDAPASQPLYEVEWKGQDDYLPDSALDVIAGRVLPHLPEDGFDLKSSQAHTKSITATLEFEGVVGPMAQQEALVAVLRSATMVRTLHANLVAARSALAASHG